MPVAGKNKKEIVKMEMKKFGENKLHSGSKKGPVVKSRDQALAISLSEAKKADKSKNKK